MKKCIFLFAFLLLGMGLSYAVENKQPGGRLTNKPVLNRLQPLQETQRTPPLTPRFALPGKLQTPRATTPRLSQKYCIPYFFDGTVQYIILKKNDAKEAGASNALLIPLSEKDLFKKKIENLFTVRSENNETLWLEKKVESAQQMNDDYELYSVDDKSLSEEIKKQIKFIIKERVLFIPLFYQIENEQLNIVIKQSEPSKENASQTSRLKIFLPKNDDLSENGSQQEVKQKINNIIKEKFKINNLEYTFLPIVISENSSQIFFMQMIDVSNADLHDASQKEYVSLSLKQVLGAMKNFANNNTVAMKGYLKNLYTKLISEENENTKIDTSFVELFLREYKAYEQNVQETLKRDEEQKEAEKRKKESIAKQKDIEREERTARQRESEKEKTELFPTVKSSVFQEIEQNLKPTKVIESKKEEKEKIKKQLEEKQNITEAQEQTGVDTSPIISVNQPAKYPETPQSKEIKQKSRSKSESQPSSASEPFKKYPQNLNHMNQIITFVRDLFHTHYNKTNITNIACSNDIKKGIADAEKYEQLWLALPLNEINYPGLEQVYNDLKNNGNATIYINKTPITCIYRSEIKAHEIVFLYFTDQNLKNAFYTQFQELYQNKKLYIGFNNIAETTLLCNDTIVVYSADSIKQWLKKNDAYDPTIKKADSNIGIIFPGLGKGKELTDPKKSSPKNNIQEKDVYSAEKVSSEKIKKLPQEPNKTESIVPEGQASNKFSDPGAVSKNPSFETASQGQTIPIQTQRQSSTNISAIPSDDIITIPPIEGKESINISQEKSSQSGQPLPENTDTNQTSQTSVNNEPEPSTNQVGFFDSLGSFLSDIATAIKDFFLVTIPNFFSNLF